MATAGAGVGAVVPSDGGDDDDAYDGAEAASVDTPLTARTSLGYNMLQKMGWTAGSGLGKEGAGIREPVRMASTLGTLGVGKQAEYKEKLSEVTKVRKKLEVEVEATEEVKARRQEAKATLEARREEVSSMNRPFYCADCDKQYKTTMEFSNHLSSYDHHHVKRLRELKAQARAAKRGSTGGGGSKAARKEQRRQEKELQRQMAGSAGGIAGGAAPVAVPAAAATTGTAGLPPAAAPAAAGLPSAASAAPKPAVAATGGANLPAAPAAAPPPAAYVMVVVRLKGGLLCRG